MHTNWYNKSLVSKTFKYFPSEIKRVKLEDLRDDEGRQVSHRRFFAGVTKDVITGTTELCSRRLGQVRHSNQSYQSKVGCCCPKFYNEITLGLRTALYTAGLYYHSYNSTNLISARIVLNSEIECNQQTANSTRNIFVFKSLCMQTPKL
jgi:hypothetical protein